MKLSVHFLFFGVFMGILLADTTETGPIAKKGKLLLSDDFERNVLGPWKVVIPGFRVKDGVLVATQDRADHGSVGGPSSDERRRHVVSFPNGRFTEF